MKKIFLLLLLPLIVATTCEEDHLNSGFETEFIIQNDSSIDLILLQEGGFQTTIENGTSFLLASDLNQETNSINPSETFAFNVINLYKTENDNFILAYKQEPINDDLWTFDEPVTNRYNYTLIITDDLLN
ncbi:hypothetical protein DIS18_09930 [Algibacter marinivivus]|uniref:Uncharacterized protein n=1 Tax=Algibacter marinivivus TaxID=2100723 RepID=A0A2U2X441_9FLAO|nr:hypothetical protein [Algibacter marinivivus]PWH82555.1 hypothetical protein DIS18_09930 [Algibacter marinivivus]